jgi:alkylhydroperoxidase family enzyme
MAFVEQIADSELFERDRAALGFVPNYTRLFAHRPAVYEAWLGLRDAILASMDTRRYELATVAAARELRSSYCTLVHGKVLADQFLGPAQVRDMVVDHRSAGLDEVDVAVMDLAEKVARDASKTLDALGVQADPAYAELDPELRDVLTVGRPIAESA